MKTFLITSVAPGNDSLSHFAPGSFSPWLWGLVFLSTCFSQPLGNSTVGIRCVGLCGYGRKASPSRQGHFGSLSALNKNLESRPPEI